MKQTLKLIFFFPLLFIVQSCATYDKEITAVSQSENFISGTTIYVIGDAGKLDDHQSSKALKALNDNIKNAGKKDVLLFLGDNIYPKGFSDSNAEEAKQACFCGRVCQMVWAM